MTFLFQNNRQEDDSMRYDDYDDYDSYGYDDYNDYDDDDYEYEERPRRTRMPEDLGFGTRKKRSSSSGYRGREPGPAGGRHTKDYMAD